MVDLAVERGKTPRYCKSSVLGYMVVVMDAPQTGKGPVSDDLEGPSMAAISAVVVDTGSRGVPVA